MFGNLEEIKVRFEEVTRLLSDPAVARDAARYVKLGKEHNHLSPIVSAYERYAKIEHELESQQEILDDPDEDPEFKQLAQQEVPTLRKDLEQFGQELKLLLVPRDPLDDSNIVLEIRAGTGGDEAALFAGDLLKMYLRYAERQGWRSEMLSSSLSEMGGFKEAILGIEGNEVYKRLKFESGVHRVQRVPRTEAQGRIHTSTATVAVLPEAEDVEVDLNERDVEMEAMRAGGPGGQNVNKTSSAVRLTHTPTGITVKCQADPSQHKNRATAMRLLKAKLYEIERERIARERSEARSSQIGTGGRSEKIRTYNFKESRVTDHRIGLTVHNLSEILDGQMREIIQSLRQAEIQERLEAL